MKSCPWIHNALGIPCFVLSALFAPAGFPAHGQNFSGPTYQQAPAKYQVLAEKVAQISANDQRQDIRLYQVEREVDKLAPSEAKGHPSPETGTTRVPALIPYTPYQVRKGDSLWRIAMNHRVSPGEVMSFNRMPNETVVEGQVLMIPQKGGGKAASSAPVASHTVQPNETFKSIGKRYGVSSDAIAKANPKINPAKLMAGARLAIPAGGLVPTPKLPPQLAYDHGLPAPKPAKAGVSHTVKPGESLSVIAHQHKVSTAALQKANGVANANTVRVGQTLMIPVGPGATAKTGADKKTKTKSLASQMTPPAAGAGLASAPSRPVPPTPPAAPPPPAPSNNRGVVAYRMDKGDTIDTVAQMFGTTGAEIRRLNRLSTTSPLHDGDEILVPGMGPVAGN